MAQYTINTEIIINASPETVWRILTDFEAYPSWNPFLTSVQGEFKLGNKIEITAGGMNFKPEVLAYDKNQTIKWIGSFLFKGLFDGEHSFYIIDNKNGTVTFRHNENFSGLLVNLFKDNLKNSTKPGFEEMNLKLKELSEKEQVKEIQ